MCNSQKSFFLTWCSVEAELSDGDEEIKEWADAFPHLRVVGHKMAIHEGIPPELSDQLSELNIEEDLA